MPLQKNIALLLGVMMSLFSCQEKKTAEQYYEKGMKCMDEKNYQEAKENFNRCIELDSTNRGAFIYRAHVNDEIGNYMEAVEDYTKVLSFPIIKKEHLPQVSPSRKNEVFQYRALSRYKAKDYNGAISDCNKIITEDSLNGDAYKIRSDSESKLGLIIDAKKDSIKAKENCAGCGRL